MSVQNLILFLLLTSFENSIQDKVNFVKKTTKNAIYIINPTVQRC